MSVTVQTEDGIPSPGDSGRVRRFPAVAPGLAVGGVRQAGPRGPGQDAALSLGAAERPGVPWRAVSFQKMVT